MKKFIAYSFIIIGTTIDIFVALYRELLQSRCLEIAAVGTFILVCGIFILFFKKIKRIFLVQFAGYVGGDKNNKSGRGEKLERERAREGSVVSRGRAVRLEGESERSRL